MQKIPAVMIEGGTGGYVYLTEKFCSTKNTNGDWQTGTPSAGTKETKYIELPAGKYYATLDFYASSDGDHGPSFLKYELKKYNTTTVVASGNIFTASLDYEFTEIPSSEYSIFTLSDSTKLSLTLELVNSLNIHRHAIFKIFPVTFTDT